MGFGQTRGVNSLFCYTSATPENNNDLPHSFILSAILPDDASLDNLEENYITTPHVEHPPSSNLLPRHFFEDNFADLDTSFYRHSIPIDLEGDGSNHLKDVITGGDYMLPTVPSEKDDPYNGKVGQEGIHHPTGQLGLGPAPKGHLLDDHAPDSSRLTAT
ncbi:hypothetical protein N7540_004730 [Penicillium herquei]|nr:hypothetical protein N7540_004730 [Penicillium herquei]